MVKPVHASSKSSHKIYSEPNMTKWTFCSHGLDAQTASYSFDYSSLVNWETQEKFCTDLKIPFWKKSDPGKGFLLVSSQI